MIAWLNRNAYSAAVTEKRVLWERREPLRKSEAQRPQIHPDQNVEQSVLGMRSFSELLAPKLDLGKGVIGLRDLQSTGMAFELTPLASEARDQEQVESIHEKIVLALCNIFPQRRQNPWLAQVFVYDEPTLAGMSEDIAAYAAAHGKADRYTQNWRETMDVHLSDAASDTGFFRTDTQTPWRAKRRRLRLCVWRRQNPGETEDPTDNLEHICDRLTGMLAHANVRVSPLEASDLHAWLATQWFTRIPEEHLATDSVQLLKSQPWNPQIASADIGRAALYGAAPESSADGVWWFRGHPSRFITVDEPATVPEIGHLTAERQIGDSKSALWDQMPAGSCWSMTVVFSQQDAVLETIRRIRHNSIGADPEAVARRKLADEALSAAADSRPIFRVFCGVYVRADELNELKRRTGRILAILSSHGLKPIAPQHDPIAQDSYIRALPFGFDPIQDERWYARRARLWHLDHIARVVPFLGRSVGTGHPGVLHFNRGAEPLAYDPLHSHDRRKNAHSLILGPTGSGKTSLLIYQLLHLLAVRRPRLYLITALPTFGLFADYCQSLGLTVARRSIGVDGAVTLPPFTEASKLSTSAGVVQGDELSAASRDILGDMEIQAKLMITGGEPAEVERLRRDDQELIRSALIEAGRITPQDRQTMISDVVAALNAAAEGKLGEMAIPQQRRKSAGRMAAAMNLLCTGADGRIFDSPGEPWPDADVTVVELGYFARKGYEDRLAIAMTGLMTAIQNRVEAEQMSGRQTIVVVDEAHVLLQNPLVSPYLSRIVATWRTYGAWLWLATQNLRQFPDSSKELLNQPEWWIMLAVDEDEVDQISRFRTLTNEQRSMILSAHKKPGRYTEGVVLSSSLLNLFRNIPPPIALALAQTEKDEKAARDRLCRKHGISELEAAQIIAEQIRQERCLA